LKGRYNLEDLDIDRRIILKWILKKCGARVWNGLISSRIGTGSGLYIKDGEFLDKPSGYYFLKKDSAPWS
jgi:hypothetical protein